jgi:hypothetical protein
MKILNLTQHPATPEQITDGVVEPEAAEKKLICKLLTFEAIPSQEEMRARAFALAKMAEGFEAAMIGGAPFFMPALERALIRRDIEPLFAFSVRESVEEVQEDGSVVKRNVFRHLGFVGL